MTMEKYITDEQTGLQYELVGDYSLIAGDEKPEEQHIGIWGQQHLRYLKERHRVCYVNLLTSSRLNSYLADIDRQAEELFSGLVTQMVEAEGITEKLKAVDPMALVRKMIATRSSATESVTNNLIYA